MRYNQYSYIKASEEVMLDELARLGFTIQATNSPKENLHHFLQKVLFRYQDVNYVLSSWVADQETDLLPFCQSDKQLTEEVFYTVALQVLGFVPFVDFDDVTAFCKEINFPISYGNILENLYQLLNTRTKLGNILIDQLVSEGFIPESNDYHFFNGKSLATFSSHEAIREVVYVESRVDTDGDGKPDLVKVSIIRPSYKGQIPAVMTASPYHQGTNDKASDKALHNMNVDLACKNPRTITVQESSIQTVEPQGQATLVETAEEKLGHIGSYTLNDYLLPRGFANLYVSGVGTKDSEGMMTSGDYQQIEAYKNVIDWLNGRCRAFTDHSRQREIKATWSNGKVATTGISYLGTMSNGLATTGVDGLEVIIAEAGISSWYNYYRENGLVTSPGGYPGEDFESLTELTYSRNLLAGEYLRYNQAYQAYLDQQRKDLERETGDYNQFWHDRNYLIHADKVKAEVVFTHGSQDWNVKPLHVYNMFHALPADILAVRREFRIDIIAYLHVAILMVHLLPFHRFGGINFRFLIAFRLTEIGCFSRCQTVEIDVCIRGNGILCAFFLSAGIGDALRVCAPGKLSDTPERCHGRLIGFTLHDVFSFIDAICGYIGHERVGDSFHVMIPMPIVHVCNPQTCSLW